VTSIRPSGVHVIAVGAFSRATIESENTTSATAACEGFGGLAIAASKPIRSNDDAAGKTFIAFRAFHQLGRTSRLARDEHR
jgi:hypothetical protein